MKTVIVIGSNSFSGSDFVDLLLERQTYKVIGISRSPEKSDILLPYKNRENLKEKFSFYQMDLNHDMADIKDLLSETKPEYIINFAAQSEVAPSWKNPEHWFKTNAVAIAEFGNYLKDQKWLERYVHISSPEVYGSCECVVNENAPLNPSTPYAASKAAGDLMLFTLVKNFDFPMVAIRATNVYGAYQQFYKIIPRTVIYLKMGKLIQLHGGGSAVKSFIHIRDVSKGELAAMEHGKTGEIYHLSPDKGVEVQHIVKMICNSMGKDFKSNTEIVAERLGQDKAYVIDSTKARNKLNWLPVITLDEGILNVVEWVDINWERIKELPLEYVHIK